MQNLEAIKADTHGAIEWVYPKDEADKVIADLKKEKEYVIDNMAEVINGQERELCHHKYKRCLAMADKLHTKANYLQLKYATEENLKIAEKLVDKIAFNFKWSSYYLELANKFKEVK